MSILVMVLRGVGLVAFAAPMLLRDRGPKGERAARAPHPASERVPLIANLASVGLFLPVLLIFSCSSASSWALPLALSGCLLALGGAVLVLRSRVELGAAWSLLPNADPDAGFVTTGPYRIVRHPIYLGLAAIASGNALAFGNWLAFSVVALTIVPTFVWRARVEERHLGRTFGARFATYRQQTRMIIPGVL